MNKKLYVVGGYDNSVDWVLDMGFEYTNDINKSHCVFFVGGSDVSPELYGEKKGSRTYCDKERDIKEVELFTISKNIPKIGVCRGGQFLTIMNGFKLVQDSRHPGYHNIDTFDGKTLKASSTHHQQFLFIPNNLRTPSKSTLIGWANKLSDQHLDGKDIDYNFDINYKEPEIVLYESNEHGKSLAIQMHPEFFEFEHPTVKYLQNLVKTHLFENV